MNSSFSVASSALTGNCTLTRVLLPSPLVIPQTTATESQVSTIPGGPEKRKLVLCCSYKRTAAQYLAISLLPPKTLPSVTKPPGVGQVSHRQWASG